MSEDEGARAGGPQARPQTQQICDMQELMERLSEMTEKQERYQNHLKAARIVSQAQAVAERRAELEREERRLADELAEGPFSSVEEARQAMLSIVDLAQLSEDIEAYREDYASTIARCVKGPQA
ncbi:MAG: hypothetical protein SOI26_02875 [Coriobacteriales bacterium]|jgi:DNA repair exonuclease SbcCD ATPase subunit